MRVCMREFGFIFKTFPLYPLVKKFAADVIAPKVKEMDENEQMDPRIIKELFDNGVTQNIKSARFFIV